MGKQFIYKNVYKEPNLKAVHNVIFLCVVVFLSLAVAQSPHTQEAEKKWKIVNFWSEWCAPCRREIPILNALNETIAFTDVILVGINFDEDPRQETLAIAETMGINFPTLSAEAISELQLGAPDVLPTTYILSPDNAVVAKMIGEQTEESLLAQLTALDLLVETD